MLDESGILQRSDTIELIKNKLYFSSCDPPERGRHNHLPYLPFALSEDTYFYTAFFADFGPLDLGLTCKFCQQLQEMLTTAQEQKKVVVFFTGGHQHKRANGAVLVLAYLILSLNYTVEQAYGPFIGIQPPFVTFRDAGFCINTFPITVLDTAKAIRKAKTLNHINLQTFSVQNFQHLNKLQNGDISWIVPGKFIAFSGPVAKRRQISPGVYTLTPEQYVPLMKSLGVTCIVRFNDKCYDRKVFVNNGIRHVDLFYEDGGNPSEGILQSFLQVCEQERGAIAVHCKAGLGRTGTNIAAYMMKHYGYTAKEATAWCRICRPGSIVGPQQQFLVSIETKMFHEGNQYRDRMKVNQKDAENNHSNSKRRMSNGNAHTNSNGTVTSGVTDMGDGSGRTTPSIFQQGGSGSGKQSNTNESLFKKEGMTSTTTGSRKENQENNNTNNPNEGLPPRSHSNGHARPTTGHHQSTKNHENASSSRDSNDMPSSSSQLSTSYDSTSSAMMMNHGSGKGSNPTNANAATASSPLGINTNASALNAQRSSSNNNSNNSMNAYSKAGDVRRSLQFTPGQSTHNNNNNQFNYSNEGLPLSRKDSKQAWNEKDLIPASVSAKLSASNGNTRQSMENSPYLATIKDLESNKSKAAGTGGSMKYTRHESPINGYSTNTNTSNNQVSSGMPPIERPRSSTGTTGKAHNDFGSNNRRVITTRV